LGELLAVAVDAVVVWKTHGKTAVTVMVDGNGKGEARNKEICRWALTWNREI